MYTERFLDYPLDVRYGEVGYDGIATLSSLANWLQEAAGLSADSLGFGERNMAEFGGLTWILTRLILRIERLPQAGEHVTVHTWPSTLERFGFRGYQVFDANGSRIVSSGSCWAIMNLSERRMVGVPAALADAYPKNPLPCDPFTCRNIPRLHEDENSSPLRSLLRVRRDDLDINGHVNNARYLSWLMEPIPAGGPFPSSTGKSKNYPALVDITFRAETFPGEELVSVCAPSPDALPDEEGSILVHAIQRISDNKKEDVCRAVSIWKE